MDRPIRKKISTIQRDEPGESASRSQRVAAHKITALKREERAYTSASTAENQNESVKANDKAPMAAAAILSSRGNFLAFAFSILEINQPMVQNKNRMVAALETADTRLMQ